ncbi:hypothetical protein DMB66_15895 [Actinoplanes sp. ATCC 53533]|uniref:hypothetical protein n=1 Tax=Actinoplanes sp. ATCC 53533 TaxID=1288362 RepID=UPI000F771037|nr:hypothetical protein [Actinoplanes sp. ATCC 53533]RSM67436.1 hypothetical protein DMB66_15895 [Actinoplanes sp. ATCC 53533]
MARKGKFHRLVDDFVATVTELGGRVDPSVVADELQSRIDAIAVQLRVTPQTVLRSYIDDGWGRQMATAMMADVHGREAVEAAGPDEHVGVRVAARLLAALGQAILFATVNQDATEPVPRLDVRIAAEAVTGLSMAVHDRPSEADLVVVSAQVVTWTRITLEAFREQVSAGAWSSCPCGEDHGQADTDAAVLRAVSADLLFLPAADLLARPGR